MVNVTSHFRSEQSIFLNSLNTQTKRRIMLSSTNNKLQIKPFFVKSPSANWKQGCWNNFAIDLYSFIEAFKGQTYRCLDSITIMGHFRLRRIYTTNMMPHCDNLVEQQQQSLKQISLLPKGFYFPPEIEQASIITRYNGQTLSQVNLYQPTQPSTKNNSSYLKSTKNNRMSTPKTQTTKSQKIVQVSNSLHGNNGSIKVQKKEQQRFLANTNGPEMLNRMRKRQQYAESSDSQSHITDNIQTPQSTQKGDLKPKKKLIKTQIMPPKARTSVQRRPKPINIEQKRQKQKLKSKLNPWRTNIKPHGQSSTSKNHSNNNRNESDNQPHNQLSTSPKLPSNNITKNNTNSGFTSSISKGFDRKSDHYSQSQYIQLSQKFSTLTDGKFFSRNNTNKNDNNIIGVKSLVERKDNQQYVEENTQEIEENIQMESNSIYSPTNEKEHHYNNNNNNNRQSLNNVKRNNPHHRQSPQKLPELINESICDSLDKKSPQKEFQHFGKQSYYGFADRLMNEYMKQKERPYSPPMREKLYTEEEQEINIQRQKQLDKDNKEVQLMYDPVINCYYDHKTHTYYELKN